MRVFVDSSSRDGVVIHGLGGTLLTPPLLVSYDEALALRDALVREFPRASNGEAPTINNPEPLRYAPMGDAATESLHASLRGKPKTGWMV